MTDNLHQSKALNLPEVHGDRASIDLLNALESIDVHFAENQLAEVQKWEDTGKTCADVPTLLNRYENRRTLRGLTHDERRAIVATYPLIHVVDFDEQGYITLENRRLYIFRAVLLPNTPIAVRLATSDEAQELRRKLTTMDEGATIVVRS